MAAGKGFPLSRDSWAKDVPISVLTAEFLYLVGSGSTPVWLEDSVYKEAGTNGGGKRNQE